MENRLAVFKHRIIRKTTFPENISCFVKCITDLIRSMCISSNRDDLAAKFAVTAYDIDAGIRLSKPVVITACGKLDTHILSDQRTQDLIQNLLVPAIRILSVLIRTITYHIINMSVHIHLIKNSNVFQNGIKIL